MSRFRTEIAVLSIAVLAAALLGGLPAHATPIVSGDLLITTTGGCCSYPPVTSPNVLQTNSTGAFKGWFFSPFVPSDIAVDKSGSVLFGSSSSGTIVATTNSGGLVRLIPTPAPSVNGIAVASNGNIVVASGSTFYELDPQGQFLSLVFSPVSLGGCCSSSNLPLGFDADGDVVFPASPTNYGDKFSLNFLNLQTRVFRTAATTFTSITGLDASETGDLIVAGTTGDYGYGSVTINRVGLDGTILSQIAGPQSVGALAVVNLPEPGPALLVGLGLTLLTLRRDRRPPR